MRSADLAQLPVIDNGRLAGIIDESDLLLHVTSAPGRFHSLVGSTMTAQLRTLPPSAAMQELRDILDQGLTAVISENQRFYGLITRFDLLNHLRRTLS
jgi:cystathionine beta-synthase